jgi:ketosteroid isomerase-like protein
LQHGRDGRPERDTAVAVTEEKIAIIRRSYEAFNRRDISAASADMHPQFELDFSGSVGPEAGTYRGEAGMRKLWERYWEAFETITIEPEEFIEVGESIVAVVRARGRGLGSGVEVDARGPHLWSFREGKVVRFTLYQEVADAIQGATNLEAERAAHESQSD